MIVCSALLISAATDSVSSDIASIVRCLPERDLQLLRDVRDREHLGDRQQRVDVRLAGTRSGWRETTLSVPTARPLATSGTMSADPKPGRVQHVDVEEVRRALARVVDDAAARASGPRCRAPCGPILKTISGRGRLRRSSSWTRAV